MVQVPTSDVEFFKMVHDLRTMARDWAQLADQRTTERRTFCCRQWIAPRLGDAPPLDEEFVPVDCRDISTGGFSFLLDDVPQSDQLHVRLGKPGAYVVLNAAVVHCIPVDTDLGPAIQVGCRFVKKSAATESASAVA